MEAYLSSKSSPSRPPPVKPARRPVKPTTAEATSPFLPSPGKDVVDLNPFSGQLKKVNDALLKTLGQEDSAITNSTAYSRTIHVQVRLYSSFGAIRP
jgi:hypothetical protein